MLKRHTGYSCGSPPSRSRGGAGVGLPGLVARSLGAEVWQTDNLTAALEIARLNARANEVGGITRFTADWMRWTDDRLYDVS